MPNDFRVEISDELLSEFSDEELEAAGVESEDEDEADEGVEASDIDEEEVEDESEEDGQQSNAGGADEDRELELARMRGYKPPSEWKGQLPKGYIDDPAEFNRRYEERMPSLVAENHKLRDEMDALKRSLNIVVDRTNEGAKREYEEKRREIRNKMLDAIKNGDTRKADNLLTQMESLKIPENVSLPEEPQEETPNNDGPEEDLHPDVKAWISRNPWYNDPKEKSKADAIAGALVSKGISTPEKDGPEFLEKVARIYHGVEKMPEEVDSNNAQNQSNVEGKRTSGGASANKGKKKTWSAMPKDARLVAEAHWIGKSNSFPDTKEGREKYAEAYFKAQDGK